MLVPIGRFSDMTRLSIKALRLDADVPPQLVPSTIHRGPYDEISPAYHTVTGWMPSTATRPRARPASCTSTIRGRWHPRSC